MAMWAPTGHLLLCQWKSLTCALSWRDTASGHTRHLPSLSRFAHTLESRKKILMQPHFKKLTNTAQYFKATFLKDDWKTFGGHDNSKAFYH